MRHRVIATLPIAVMLMATAGLAQNRSELAPGTGGLRQGMPGANPVRPLASADAGLQRAEGDFAAWSRRQGNPRILLFWNVRLSDESSTRSQLVIEDDSVTSVGGGAVLTSRDVAIGAQSVTGGPYSLLDADQDGELESAFVSTFLRAGGNIADRAALMRKTSTRDGRGDRADLQFIEALALEQGIDYLVEVLPAYRNASATGITFAVKILHVPTSRVVATFRTDALPEQGPERLVARPGGFRRERADRLSTELVAETLAAETMQRFR